MRNAAISISIILFWLLGCVEPFSPPEIKSRQNYLVVDGYFNVAGNDTSRFELRRTQNVNQAGLPVLETGAELVVEEEAGAFYPFSETRTGVYELPPATYNGSGKYRLRIRTKSGNEYLSDYVSVTRSPPIDSLAARLDPVQNAMVFYVNTHDPQNNTRFYRWKFEETWEYEATYYSALFVRDDTIRIREENINRCWTTKPSGSILLGSTVRLSEDVIKDLPLIRVPVSTNKLYRKYSLLVRQYALSQDAFEYWTELAKTTQATGSLFDPQPSQVTGNIKSTGDPQDLVFGYFSAASEATKRLTISPRLGAFPRCTEPDTIPIRCSGTDDNCGLKTQLMLLSYWGVRADSVLVATPDCTDCRLSGGTTSRPPYW